MKTAILLGLSIATVLAMSREAAAQTAGAAGQRAYVDPVTGSATTPPHGAEDPLATLGATRVPLVAEPGRTQAGGVMVDLGESLLYAHEERIGADGQKRVKCEPRRE